MLNIDVFDKFLKYLKKKEKAVDFRPGRTNLGTSCCITVWMKNGDIIEYYPKRLQSGISDIKITYGSPKVISKEVGVSSSREIDGDMMTCEVGDEVVFKDVGSLGIITKPTANSDSTKFYCLRCDGSVKIEDKADWSLTGKHYDLKSFLKQIEKEVDL